MLRIRQVIIPVIAICAMLMVGAPKVEAGSTGPTGVASSPSPSPKPSQTPPGLVLSTGVGISPASRSILYSLIPKVGSSPATDTVSFTDQYDSPALSIVLLANFPAWRVGGYTKDGGAEWLYGTVGVGTNKTDLITGLSLGGTDGQSFLTIGVRQISTQELLGRSVGQNVPANTTLSDITFNRHATRFFLSYTVNANALGCLVPIFKTPQGGCGSSTPMPSPSPSG